MVGHSYLPNDRDYGSMETARCKESHLYTPNDWCQLIKKSRRQNPFTITAMTEEEFVSFKPLTKAFVNRKLNTNKQKVDWLQIRWIRVTKDKPLQFQYRYSHNTLERWKTVDLERNTRVNHLIWVLFHCQNSTAPSTAAKKKDLLDLLQYVPPVHHTFYQQLLSDDIDGNEGEESEQENGGIDSEELEDSGAE